MPSSLAAIGHGISKHKAKSPRRMTRASYSSLTMSYFHTGIRTIIGAEAFHGPVRDGKEWDHLAMVIRLNWSPSCTRMTANSQSRPKL